MSKPRPVFLITCLFGTGFLCLFLSTGAAHANTIWQIGQVITYDSTTWGDTTSAASQLLNANFATVYASVGGQLLVGNPPPGGFYMLFTNVGAVDTYLPAGGAIGTLTGNVVNPFTTSAGTFGEDVVALKLNIDFSNAGFLLGTSGIPFGNLVLQNFATLPALNGLTVSQFLGDANSCLGGGACIYSVVTLDDVAVLLNFSFYGGTPKAVTLNGLSFSAQNNLAPPTVSPVPEPSSLAVVGSGLVGLLGWSRRLWRR